MRILAALIALSCSCLRTTTFHCTSSTECTKGGVAGECQAETGVCSFADTGCASGQRYGELSGSVAGQCVGAAMTPDAPPGYYKVGGTVSGLAGTGLVLHDNGADALTVDTSGPFAFATSLMTGKTYDVTVATQPTMGTCSVGMGSGTIASADVTNVAVTCTGAGGDPGIFCGGSTYCTASTMVCCNPNGTPTCTTSGACAGARMSCDDAADCGSSMPICCARVNGAGNWQSSQCQSSCGAPNLVMCDPNVSGACATGACKPWAKLTGYYACQ